MNSKLTRDDHIYMNITKEVSNFSWAVRKKVGCIIVQDTQIISTGVNGMPAGMDNCCEHLDEQGNLVTNPEVSHAEENALMKIAKSHHSSLGATAYVTLEPCMHCAKLLYNAGLSRVVIGESYRNNDGTRYLEARGIHVVFLE